MIQRLLTAYYAGRMRARREKFERLMADKDSGVGMMVQNRAMEMAMMMVMRWLDNKRIRHCAVCPSTETLRGLRDKFWCLKHFEEAQKALAEHEKEEVQKQNVVA